MRELGPETSRCPVSGQQSFPSKVPVPHQVIQPWFLLCLRLWRLLVPWDRAVLAEAQTPGDLIWSPTPWSFLGLNTSRDSKLLPWWASFHWGQRSCLKLCYEESQGRRPLPCAPPKPHPCLVATWEGWSRRPHPGPVCAAWPTCLQVLPSTG